MQPPCNIDSCFAALGPYRAFVVLLTLATAMPAGLAQDAERDDPGYFEVRSASVDLEQDIYFLTAQIQYRLSSEAREALDSGVSLRIRVEVEILARRRFWVDTEQAGLNQVYRLEYHALTERYIVTNLNSGDESTFGGLSAALNRIGNIERLPVIDRALLDPERGHDIRIRAVLDTEQLPGPLRLLAFWRRDWSLGSEWYRWPLERE